MRDWIADAGYGGTYITKLCRVWLPDVVDRHVAELADTAMSHDQVEILTCAVCGDRDCGAILTDILIAARSVTWHNWQYTDSGTTEALSRMPAMVFDVQLYRAALAAAPDAVAGLPYDEEAHRPRRMLWPWQWGWRLP